MAQTCDSNSQLGNGIRFISEHPSQWRKLSNFLESASTQPPTWKYFERTASAKLNLWQKTLKTQHVVGKHFASRVKEQALHSSEVMYFPWLKPNSWSSTTSLPGNHRQSQTCIVNLHTAIHYSPAFLWLSWKLISIVIMNEDYLIVVIISPKNIPSILVGVE